ncbi:hypothetical protein T4D_16072 [Trichinella pseudospiralis]|uniref:Uncharacterized protein n=1 Tax=Trichinella pseudospiralis TaxID=6337 RepID=A0A0V1FNK3_TRIPS|nr:hypothetical protein T4D_16072 [Trichinella pseudospiralis]
MDNDEKFVFDISAAITRKKLFCLLRLRYSIFQQTGKAFSTSHHLNLLLLVLHMLNGRSEHFFKHSRLKFSSLGCVKFDESAVTMTQENASCKWQLFIRKKSDIIAHLLGDGFC